MKAKKLLTAAALVASIATVTSCQNYTLDYVEDSNDWYNPVEFTGYKKGNANGSTVNLSVHYVSSGYHFAPSYQGDSAVTGIGGETLTRGTVLPAWQEMANNLNMEIKDSTRTSEKDAKNEWQYYLDKGSFGDIDLIMVDGTNSITAANTGKLVSINDLLSQHKLPNFQNWLEQNGGIEGKIWNSMRSDDGKVYYLPYFDGMDNLEKMWMMNQEYIEKLLDGELPSNLDTKPAQTSNFKPQVPFMNNEAISISVNGVKENDLITVNFTEEENVIAQQNALTVKNGQTYVQTLRNYIDSVYRDYIGPNNIYKRRSEIFTSESACYNADELIALMRCVVNNSQFLANTDFIYAFAPRNGEGNRLKQMMEFTNIWGAKGVSSESGRLYFDKNGSLLDARTQEYSLDNLDKMHELYKEGFFPGNFYTGYGNVVKTEWRSNLMKTGQLFAAYDFNATTTAFNKDARGDEYKTNLIAMLPPVAAWDAGDNSGEHKYFHYSEDNRALKKGGWAIPAESDNIDGAAMLMDYLFSPEGNDIQDFGPNNTSYRAAVTKYDEQGFRIADPTGVGTINYVANDGSQQSYVRWSDNVIKAKIGKDSLQSGWNNFCQKYIGSTSGVGHVRSDGVDLQTTVSASGKAGLEKLNTAVHNGTVRMATSSGENFFLSVPYSFALSTSDQTRIQNSYITTIVGNFWRDDSSANGNVTYCYWITDGSESDQIKAVIGSRASFVSTFTEVDKIYLRSYRAAYIKYN